MLSTICTVIRSIPSAGRIFVVRRLPISLFCLVLFPAFLHAGPVLSENEPTDAFFTTASVFYSPADDAADTTGSTSSAIDIELKSDVDAENPGTDPEVISAELDALNDAYVEERQDKTGFELLVHFLERSYTEAAPDPPWPDFGRFDLPISYNEQVKRAIHVLRNDAHEVFAGWLGGTNRYRAMIQSILAGSGLPGDLFYVALVESGLNPRARTADGGAGLWQLSKEDAGKYGLVLDSEVDERYDPEKSTRAAAARFKDLFMELGSWELVLAAHHAGSTPLQRVQSLSLWNMRLPRQSIPFVSYVMASAVISKSPGEFGFEPPGGLPLIHESVPVQRAMVLEEVAEGMKIPVEQLRELNPELRRWKALPGYNLKVPLGKIRSYTSWAGIEPPGPDPSELTFYRVRRGDTLGRIARRFGVRTGDIIAENNIRRPNRLRIGQVLTIPLYGSSIRTASQSIRNREPRNVPPPDPSTHRAISYRIRRGDTLASISRRYGVSMANLQDWNGLRNPSDIIAGQKLTIYLPRTRGAATDDTPTSNFSRESTTSGGPIRGEGGAAGSYAILYTVKTGDTLWEIAREHNVTVNSILRTNNLGRLSSIHPGDRLQIDLSNTR